MLRKKIKKLFDPDSGYFSDGTKFRLANVRAPEHNQKGASKAKRTVAGMIGRSKGVVSVSIKAKDRYGRLVVDMKNKDGSINERMRKKGYTNKGW